MSELQTTYGRSARLEKVLRDLLTQAPEFQAAAVVSFDGLPMASVLPPLGFDEDRVAAMSAALLSLGERASQGLGRGYLNQVYVEGEEGTVFLVSADDEAVLVAVGAKGAKVGLMLFEVRRAATAVADALRADLAEEVIPEPVVQVFDAPQLSLVEEVVAPVAHAVEVPAHEITADPVPAQSYVHVADQVYDQLADATYEPVLDQAEAVPPATPLTGQPVLIGANEVVEVFEPTEVPVSVDVLAAPSVDAPADELGALVPPTHVDAAHADEEPPSGPPEQVDAPVVGGWTSYGPGAPAPW